MIKLPNLTDERVQYCVTTFTRGDAQRSSRKARVRGVGGRVPFTCLEKGPFSASFSIRNWSLWDPFFVPFGYMATLAQRPLYPLVKAYPVAPPAGVPNTPKTAVLDPPKQLFWGSQNRVFGVFGTLLEDHPPHSSGPVFHPPTAYMTICAQTPQKGSQIAVLGPPFWGPGRVPKRVHIRGQYNGKWPSGVP